MVVRKGIGIDWDAIRAEYVKKATPEELGLVPKPPRVKRSGPDKYGDGSRSEIPRSRILRMYEQGMKVREIAEHFGVHKSGIYKHLEAAAERGQVKLRDDRRTPEKCRSGLHSMKPGDPNVRVDQAGTRRTCRACEALRKKERAERAERSQKDQTEE